MPSTLANWLDIPAAEEVIRKQTPERVFEWRTVDETTDGLVRFITTVDIDAPTPDEVSEDAWSRMFCFYIIGRLSGEALIDARQSLADVFSWQMEQARHVLPLPEPRRHAVSKIRRVERSPFVIDEN